MLQPQLMLQPEQGAFASVGSLKLPVLNLGLPIASSTQLADFFHCGGGSDPDYGGMVMAPLKASHYKCELDSGETDYCGQCIRRNLDAGLPPLFECGGYQVFAQMDGPWDGNSECNLPQVSHLFNLHKAYPNATFVLPLMAAEKWVDSITDWFPEGRLRGQFSRCNLPLCPEPCVDNNAKFAAFYEHHATSVRKFVAKHPSHKLIEINLEGETKAVGSKLAAATGLPAKCWAPGKHQGPEWAELEEDRAASSRPTLQVTGDIQDALDAAAAKAAAANKAANKAASANRLQDVPVNSGEIGDGDPLPRTSEGPLICTDMDLNMGIPTRSAFSGLCCTWCKGDEGDVSSAGKICCPTKAMKSGEDQIMKLEPTEFIEHNMCCGPDDPEEACLDESGVTPASESDKVIRIENIEVTTVAERVSLVIKPASEYYPTWPQHSKRMKEEGGRADTLSSGRLGYLFNGRKTGATLGGLLQLNMCNERSQSIDLCFEDENQNPIEMKKARIQILDIDMAPAVGMKGPEAIQFSCPGGQITLYGTPPWHTMTHEPHTIDKDWYTVPGQEGKTLDRYVYDCPGEDKVTFWSKRNGLMTDNPTTTDGASELTMDSLVQVELVDTTCQRFNFANMPAGYRQEAWEARYLQPGNKKKTAYSHPGYETGMHARDGGNPLNQTELPLDADFPAPPAITDKNGNAFIDADGDSHGGIKTGDCAADGGGRNFQFAGFYNPTDLASCDPPPPPPMLPPPPPTPVSIGGDPIFHSGDSWLKFRLAEEDKMTPLLAWKQTSGRSYVVLGSTFSSRMKGSDQWFNKLAVEADGKIVLHVEIGPPKRHLFGFKTMRVQVDRKHLEKDIVYSHDGMFQVTRHTRPNKPTIGNVESERLRLHWGHGYEFEISSSAADFPKHPDMAERWAHLNLHFDELPANSTGMLAELAGALPMSKATRALVSKMNEPAKTQTKMLREQVQHGVSLRSTLAQTLA
jgi:hypothetical protein